MFGRKKQTKEKVELTKESYQKAKGVFRYLRPYSFLIFIGLICLLLSTAGSFLFPILLGNLVDAGTPNALDNSPVAAVAGDVLDDLKDVDVVAVILLVLFFVQAIFSFFRIYIFNHITEKVLAALRLDTYAHLVKLPLAFYSKRRVGELNSRISSDTATLSGVMTTSIAEFFRQIIMLFASIVYLFIYSTDLTLAMLATLPVVAISAVFFGRFIKKLSKTTQDEIANSNTIVEETMTGILNVKAFANEVYEIVRYRNANERIRKIAMKGAGWRAAFVSFIIFFVFGAIVFIIWRAVNMGVNNGELVTFITFCVLIGASISSLPDLYSSLQKAVGASENLMNILEETPEDLDTEAKTQINKVAGDVAFENVSFAYPSRKDSPVLQDLSFEVKAGKLAAIVGPSGAGKSTIVSMLLRFYEPESGLIRIDGKPATEYSLTELRKQMALVPQEVLLFGGSIRENIAYGDPDATEEQIIEAAKKANAHEFVSNFSEGYDTLVGERGIQLSGGQRQRIAIARAILKDPAILILDEATSSLDSESERLVQDALEKLMQGRTSFVVAHRLSTIKSADKILVIESGSLKEVGTHDELILRENGLYKHLSQLQFEGNEVAPLQG